MEEGDYTSSVIDNVSYKCGTISLVMNIAAYSLKCFLLFFRHWIRKASAILEKNSLKNETNKFRKRTAENYRRQALHLLKVCYSILEFILRRLHVQVKQLRLEREREKAMRETELEMLQREKEAEHFKTWAEQEDNFHLQQAKLR